MYLSVLGLLVVAAIILIVRAALVARSVVTYKKFWDAQNAVARHDGSIHLLALGDSVSQAIGASSPRKGLVGLVADYVARQTGRVVYVENRSITGATTGDVVAKLLPLADVHKADIVTVTASANDVIKKIPLNTFENNLRTLLASLPSQRTIVAEVPYVRRRKAYQRVLKKVTTELGFTTADYDRVMSQVRWPLQYVAADFLHPNDRGYRDLWFESFKPHVDAQLQRLKTEAK